MKILFIALLLTMTCLVKTQSLKPIPIVKDNDTIMVSYTLPQLRRLIEIVEKGILSSDSLQILKQIAQEQNLTISTQELQILNEKAATDNMGQQAEVLAGEVKQLKKRNFWQSVKLKISGLGNILLIILVLIISV